MTPAVRGGPGDHPRGVHRRRPGRRDLGQQGQGLRRRHEAPQLQGPGRQPRQPQAPSGARLHRAPAPPRPGCSRGPRWRARWAPRKVTTLNLEVIQSDPERELLLVRGAVPGSRGSVVADPGQRKEEGPLMPRALTCGRSTGSVAGSVDPRRAVFGIAAQCRRDAPGRDRPAGGRPVGDPEHQDPCRGVRRWQEAFPPEGDGPGPPGFQPGRPTGPAVAWPSGPSPAPTASAHPAR